MDRDQVIEYLRGLSAHDLVRLLGDVFSPTWGVAPIGGAIPVISQVRLIRFNNKISVIKALRTVCPWLGLAEAKRLVESAPLLLPPPIGQEEWSPAEALRLAFELQGAGAFVELC